jgi:hypothetical protein
MVQKVDKKKGLLRMMSAVSKAGRKKVEIEEEQNRQKSFDWSALSS